MLRQRRAHSHHQLDRAPILKGIVSIDLRLNRVPLLGLVMNNHAARLRRVAIVHLLAVHSLGVRAGQRHIPQKRALILIDPHSIRQPVLVASQPGQQRRQVALAALRVADLINRKMHHLLARDEPAALHRRIARIFAANHVGVNEIDRVYILRRAWTYWPLVEP